MTEIMTNAERELDPMYARYQMPLIAKEYLDAHAVAYTFAYRHLDVRVEMWPGRPSDQNTIYQAFARPRGARRLLSPVWSPVIARDIAGPGTTTTTIDELMMNVVASVAKRDDVQRALQQLKHWPDDYA